MNYWTEKYQLGIITDFLRSKGMKYSTEVPMYSKRIDIIALQRDRVIAIEMKTRDFKRGISQAKRNTSLADYSYLSVWSEYVTEDLISRVDELDIGLFSISDNVQCLSSPRANNPNRHARSTLRENAEHELRNESAFPTHRNAVGRGIGFCEL